MQADGDLFNGVSNIKCNYMINVCTADNFTQNCGQAFFWKCKPSSCIDNVWPASEDAQTDTFTQFYFVSLCFVVLSLF